MNEGKLRAKSYYLVSLIIILALLPVLASCSNNNAVSSATSSSSSSTKPIPSESSSGLPETTQEPVTLTALTWFVGPNQALYDKFHEMYPWITIEANTKIDKAIVNNVIAGENADLVFLDAGLSQWLSGDLLEDLGPYIEKDTRIQGASMADGFIEAFQTGGKQWVVPYSDIPMWIVVNTEMLHKYGMEMPGNDWTYDDLLEMAKQATDPATNDWGISGLVDEFTSIMTMANGSADNYRYMNGDNSSSLVNTPALLEDLKWSQELTTKWHVRPSDIEREKLGMQGDSMEVFLQGNSLFTLGADWVLESLDKATFEWDVLPLPVGKAQQATVHQAGAIGIPKSSKHKDEAFLYISFLFDLEAQKTMIENGSGAWVQDQVLYDYYAEVPRWQGKNVDAIRMNTEMCCFSRDPAIADLVTLVDTVNGPIAAMITKGGDFSSRIPAVEAYNLKAAETRKALGW
ncbi:extracellular solute-binding protein [Cohnella sp. WQ 127256]|uniref:extracellular solute-binding protein n=1 Tax=Cohnella sp. WQ 127256 TaxID=2938790 RepID=UPI0021178D40|nr:extracellular solute-binding protein [Cohnella sp. WQ 127256]